MRRHPYLVLLFDYLLLTAGALSVAAGLALFLIPNNVIAGGVTGIAQIMHTTLGTPVGLVSWLLNIPLFVLGWRYLGGLRFLARTVYATTVLSFAIDLMTPLAALVDVQEPLLYVFYGGMLDGIGVGIIFQARGTTGGLDILARLLERWRNVRPGQAILVLSSLVFVAAGWVYGAEELLYALLVTFMAGRVIDVILEGYSHARSALIIAEKADEVRAALLSDLGRGVTVLEGQGGYTATDRPVLLCVVSRSEISILKELVFAIDPSAFVIINDASEVLGEGFRVRG